MKCLLVMIHGHQRLSSVPCRRRPELIFSGLSHGKLYEAPAFRSMHINDALRRPDPVIFRRFWNPAVFSGIQFVLPFNSREVDAPVVTGTGWSVLVSKLTKCLPGNGDFHGPMPVPVGRIVQSAVHVNGRLQPGESPSRCRPCRHSCTDGAETNPSPY